MSLSRLPLWLSPTQSWPFDCQIPSTPVRSPQLSYTKPLTSVLLRLPSELRLQIYDLTLAHCFCGKNAYSAHVARYYGHIHTSLLLVNRQIYAESRHLPFQTSVFKFRNFYGSGIYNCRRLLSCIAEWQLRRLQYVDLTIVERDLTGGPDDGWLYVCNKMGGPAPHLAGLRSLKLRIDGNLSCKGANVLSVDKPFIVQRLQRLKMLKDLEIVIEAEEVEQSLIDELSKKLQELLDRTALVVRKAEKPSSRNGRLESQSWWDSPFMKLSQSLNSIQWIL